MSTPRLPLTVIGGYLGAGKTTLINRILTEETRQRLLVLVNDFGAIDIDAALLESADEDTLRLSNGCVCCTMGGDLFEALDAALRRMPRPDHLLIEASGIADPSRIAATAKAEPELSYGGTCVVVDAAAFPALSGDARIGTQIRDQVASADLVLISKAPADLPEALRMQLAALTRAPIANLSDPVPLAPIVLGVITPAGRQTTARAHPAYVSWSHEGDARMTRDALEQCLRAAPEGVYRIKGFVLNPQGGAWEVHKVGPSIQIRPGPVGETRSRIVCIGAAETVTREEIAAWWRLPPRP